MTAVVVDLAAARAHRAEQAAGREAAKADAIAKAHPQARACSLASLEQVPPPEPFIEEPLDAEPEEPEPIRWRTSTRGNPWAVVGDLHIVVFPDRGNPDQWLVRVQRGEGRGRYVKHLWPSAEAAQQSIERVLKDAAAKSARPIQLFDARGP